MVDRPYNWRADGTDHLAYGHLETNFPMPYIVQMHWCMMEEAEAAGNTKWPKQCRLFDNDVWGRKRATAWKCPQGMSGVTDPCQNTVAGVPDLKAYKAWIEANSQDHPGLAKCMGRVGTCFPATAQVRLQDGTTKTLEELGPSDLVETTADFKERGYERWLFDFHGSMGARQSVVVETNGSIRGFTTGQAWYLLTRFPVLFWKWKVYCPR